MLIQDMPEPVCSITRMQDVLTLLVIEPNGRTGGFSMEVKDIPAFLNKIKSLCPELESNEQA